MMASRWAYEAMAVYQFRNNSYEQPYFDLHKIESQSDFRSSFLVDELNKRRKAVADNYLEKNDSVRLVAQENLSIIQTSIQKEFYKKGLEGVDLNTPWTVAKYTPAFDKKLDNYFNGYRKFFQDLYNKAVAAREKLIVAKEADKNNPYSLNLYKNYYYSESLADLVTNVSEKNRIIEHDGELVQQINPIFLDARPQGLLDYRAHFFAAKKNLLGAQVSTYWFNVMMIWIMTLFLYAALYFELLKKLVNSFENVSDKVSLPKVGSPKKK
jgi:hypothetical protein